jgi:hypothetical protein
VSRPSSADTWSSGPSRRPTASRQSVSRAFATLPSWSFGLATPNHTPESR